MKRYYRAVPLISLLFLLSIFGHSQTPSAQRVVPNLVNVSSTVLDAQGRAIRGIAGVTLGIYSEQYGGSPLFSETQNVTADSKGNFTAQLGATRPDGLPLSLFASGEARWLGIRANGGEEHPRVLLLSVPYALKAADAETVGGLPASAFLRAPAESSPGKTPPSSATANGLPALPATGSTVTTTGGTAGEVPLFTSATNVQNSVITQTGSASSARIGIGVTTPVARLDVNGPATIRGNLNLPTTGTATGAGGKNSQSESFTASTFNSTTGTAVTQAYRWQAEPAYNNTAAPGATLNLLYSAGGGSPVETGLYIGNNNQYTTFSPGTITAATSSGTPAVTGNDTAPAGLSSIAVYGYSKNGDAVDAYGVNGITGVSSGSGGDAGYFLGNVEVTDTLNATFKNFKIDHPLDPANLYLYHTSVESSEMMNIYTGNVTLNSRGHAEVTLPSWFESLNGDFRYQLTALGAPGPNLYVASEISGGRFAIAGGRPGMRVSWQVTAIRQDAYAKAHPLMVEQPKPENERGRYIHPELYGESQDKHVAWATHRRPQVPIPPQPVAQDDGDHGR